MVDGFGVNLAANAAQSMYDNATDTTKIELARIRDLLDILVNEARHPEPDKHVLDRIETLIAGAPLDLAYDKAPPTLYHVAIFVWGTAVTNVTIASGIGGAQVAIALPQNKWTALEFPFSPSSPMLTLASGTSVACVLRYSDERWGAVLP